jgi:hypothetical protein
MEFFTSVLFDPDFHFDFRAALSQFPPTCTESPAPEREVQAAIAWAKR